jgi:hypothetical protein
LARKRLFSKRKLPLKRTAITPIYLNKGQKAQKEVSNFAPILNDFLIKVYSKKASEAKIFASFAANFGNCKPFIIKGFGNRECLPDLH